MNIDWDVLTRYLAGVCADEEREKFERWLAEAPERRAVLQGAQDMIAEARHEVPAARAAELLASLRHGITAASAAGSRPPVLRVVRGGVRAAVAFPLSARRTRWDVRLKAAAAVLLVAGGATLWVTLSQTSPVRNAVSSASSFKDIVTRRGQRLAFQLPDGSAVVLAPGSRLRVPGDYGARDRTVSLVGEAAFTVRHDAARPFAVHTARGVARDLGTRFVVREYEEDASVQVVVAEGEVELHGRVARGGKGTVLTPGQLGRVGADGEVVVRPDVDVGRYLAWTEGRLVFRDTPLRDAAAQLARWYDIEVRLASDALAGRHLTASVRDEPAGDALRMVAASVGLELQISGSGRVYTLRAPDSF